MPLEAIPTEKQTVAVLEQALPNLGLTALIRNLGRYTEKGILASLSANTKMIVEKLNDMEALRKARIHPLQVLAALAVYKQGHGIKGSLSWNAVPAIVDALDEAFYLSFGVIQPTGLNWFLGLDVSGSMSSSQCSGLPFITCSMASAAMAMVAARTEKNHVIMGFGTNIMELDITPKMRLDAVLRKISNLNFGGTDCALPMIYAKQHKMEVDIFCVLTDGETWFGKIHPTQALHQYRQASGRNAREIVVGMMANPFTIADPNDSGQLDIVGFDTSAPQIMSDFALGKI
jgi:60 kDa SS-A/Ro ribonucleoprotein